MSIPKPPSDIPVPPPVDKSGELDPDESSYILKTTLKAKHLKDKIVIGFIDSFVNCQNIKQASEENGIHPTLGYSIRHRKDVANAIQKLIERSAVKYGFDGSEIMERAKEMVDFDPVYLQNPDGSWKDKLSEIPPEIRRCIKKFKAKNIYEKVKDMNGMDTTIITGRVMDYEWYDKPKITEIVGKEKNLFKTITKHEHGFSKDMQKILLESNKRADKVIEDFSDREKETIIIQGEVIEDT